MSDDASEARQWLQTWVIEVPDVRVAWCSELLGLPTDYRYFDEMSLQTMISAAAFVIEHPEKMWDDVTVYQRGVEGALRAYETLLRFGPEARAPVLDELVTMRDNGTLASYVAQSSKTRCQRPNTQLLMTLAGVGSGLLLAFLVSLVSRRRRVGDVAGTERDALMPGQPSRANAYRRIVLSCVVYFVLAVIALHFLEPEFDPRFRFMSEYVWGTYGWLMVPNFFVLGLAAATVAVRLRQVLPSTLGTRMAFGLMVVGAVFICLAGVFREFLPHAVASAVGLPSVIMASLLYSWIFGASREWRAIHLPALLIALGMVIGTLDGQASSSGSLSRSS